MHRDVKPENAMVTKDGTTASDIPVQWSEEGRSICLRNSETPARVVRVDVETGRRTLWKEIIPGDPSGATIGRILLTPDGKSYAYALQRDLSKLYLVKGLK